MTAANETVEKINLTFLNGTGYVFNVDDYIKLRRKHRIVGALVGTCSVRGWSANDCTLPMELTPHETRFLLERGIAQLVSKQESLLRIPDAIELAQNNERLEAGFSAQAETSKAEKLRETERHMTHILAGKRKKLLKAGVTEADIKLNAAQILEEVANKFVFDRKNAQLEIACAHPQPHAFKLVEPSPSFENPLKYQVFSELWTRGYYVTAGDTFGADFLLYPGDPLQYHASHIVVLLETPVVEPLYVIAKVRLSVAVNKICIFAYFGDEREEGDDAMEGTALGRKIHYQTVQWEGNRDKVDAKAGTSGES